MKNLKHENYNRIRSIILNPKNNFNHIVSIGNLVRNFENTFGINSLSLRLNELKTDYIKTL